FILGARHHWPSRRDADQCYELTPSHSRLSSTMTEASYQMIAQGALAIAALRLRVPKWDTNRPERVRQGARTEGPSLNERMTSRVEAKLTHPPRLRRRHPSFAHYERLLPVRISFVPIEDGDETRTWFEAQFIAGADEGRGISGLEAVHHG